ncbi:ABC transporter ATP-binding protein [Candidatus Bathyarchaeota archaeon]|nr:ABC transporter ATP-binding protein [Candidatus Bathyarchaeota archaeon]
MRWTKDLRKEPLLEIRHLKTYFYSDEGVVRAVDDVSLNIGREEVLGVVGESGCGKSTLALSILRLIRPPGKIVGGEIIFDGKDLLKLSEEEMRKIRGAKISMVFQDPTSCLNPVFTVGSQIEETVILHQKLKGKERLAKVIEMLRKVRIPSPEERYKNYPHQFSGGMRQRVMLAIALSCNPDLLIADEPTTNLDVTIQAQVLSLMKDLQREFKSSILLVTHNMGVIAKMSDRVAVMYAGKIVEVADVIPIFEKPYHPYTEALLRSIPKISKIIERLESIPGVVPSLVNPPPGCRFHPRCRYAKEICKREEPPLIEIEPGHLVACHLHK